jgi:hypothetical protein
LYCKIFPAGAGLLRCETECFNTLPASCGSLTPRARLRRAYAGTRPACGTGGLDSDEFLSIDKPCTLYQ